MSTATAVALDPREIWHQLSSIDLRLVDELAFLCRMRQSQSQSGAAWCHPGEKWLAKRLRCSAVTISRHVSKLKALGVLSVFQPRKVEGRWQTNVYRLLSRTTWRLARIRHLIERVAHRKPHRVHYSPLEIAKDIKSDKRQEFDTLFSRWMARGTPDTTPSAQ